MTDIETGQSETSKSRQLINNRYEVVARLGTGAMGVVFRALDKTGDLGEVAVKILIPLDFKDPSMRYRFEQEIALMRALEHPNLIRIHDFGQTDNAQQFMAMEYIDGGTLEDRLYKHPEPLGFHEACVILRDIAKGLASAHKQGIVHRDLKPANVMLTKSGQAKVADFGLARYTDAGFTITKSGDTVGTPYYMAPEQFRHHRVGHSADIYALGIIAYEMATKNRPFTGAYEEIALAHIRKPVPSFYKKDSGIPRWFETFTLICLEKEPKNRFQSMDDIVLYLDKQMAKMGLLDGGTGTPVKESWLARLLSKLIGE